jgi:SAM-dependent methyltransferase
MNLEFESRSCPLCSSEKERRVVVESNIDAAMLTESAFASRKYPEYMHPRMVECAGCGLLYANPVLSHRTVFEAYQKATFDSGHESAFASQTYAKLVEAQLKSLGRCDSALDIGAGDGSFVEQVISLGFRRVIGVEPSAAPIAVSKSEIRGSIRHDVFRSRDFVGDQFDLVTCFQIMEHLREPQQLVLDVFSLLRPGGLLVTVAHNINALSAMILGTRSPIFDIEHLQLFSKETLAALLWKSGFIGVCVLPIWNRYPVHYWLKLAPLPRGVKKVLVEKSKGGLVGNIACSMPAGNIAAIAWKPG